MQVFKNITKNLPIFFTAVMLSAAVWVLTVTNTVPVERRVYSRPVELEIAGLGPALIITSELPEQVSMTLSAPASTWAAGPRAPRPAQFTSMRMSRSPDSSAATRCRPGVR